MEKKDTDYISLKEIILLHQHYKVDVVVFYPPNEKVIGDYISKQIGDFWKKNVVERREFQEKCVQTSLYAPEWKGLPDKLRCEMCNSDILPEQLNCFAVDSLHIYEDDFLEDLRMMVREQNMMCFLIVTNKMLVQWELMSRFFFLQSGYNRQSQTQEKLFHLLMVEDLSEHNFLFNGWKFIKLFCKTAFGTLFPRVSTSEKNVLKKCLATFFSQKAYINKYRHSCYADAMGYTTNSDDDGYDTVDKIL